MRAYRDVCTNSARTASNVSFEVTYVQRGWKEGDGRLEKRKWEERSYYDHNFERRSRMELERKNKTRNLRVDGEREGKRREGGGE